MREAIRARTAAMGLEKSKVSADYIAQRQQQAVTLGSAAAVDQEARGGNDSFAGLDLSQISTTKVPSQSQQKWGVEDEELPSMFYDPEDELTVEQRAAIDPMLQRGILEQGLNELKSTKWPDPVAALREVVLMVIVIAVTGALIIGWDKLLRGVYTDVLHFIPSASDMKDYMQRFDGLDLPPGWTDNMNDADVTAYSDTITGATSASSSAVAPTSLDLPSAIPLTRNGVDASSLSAPWTDGTTTSVSLLNDLESIASSVSDVMATSSSSSP
jgi:hypothetical protein